jgi:hypothetical protein
MRTLYQEYDFDIQHIPGRLNVIADASRVSQTLHEVSPLNK